MFDFSPKPISLNDQDAIIVALVSPFAPIEKTMNFLGKNVIKLYYELNIIGDLNLKTNQRINNEITEKSKYEVRCLINDYRARNLIFTPLTLMLDIDDLVKQHHTILLIVRHGERRDVRTTYSVTPAIEMSDHELNKILPKLSREDLISLELENSEQ